MKRWSVGSVRWGFGGAVLVGMLDVVFGRLYNPLNDMYLEI